MNMFRRVGAKARLVSEPEAVTGAEKILLPGVGAFDVGMRRLRESGMIATLMARANEPGVAILGICLGMQMLANGSEEGVESGLGIIAGRCVRFQFPDSRDLKVPHMGWNVIRPQRASPLLSTLDDEPRFYFVHSYHLICDDPLDVLATTEHGGEFVAMVRRGNIYGAQFHPEKSHRFGMALLKAFAEL